MGNPFFFPAGTKSVTYAVGGNAFFEQPLTLRIQAVVEFECGVVYDLRLDYFKNLSDSSFQMGIDRLGLGYFLVTEKNIYRVPFSYTLFGAFEKLNPDDFDMVNFNLEDYEDIDVTFFEEFEDIMLICSEDGVPDINKGVADVWHNYTEVDGDLRIFHTYFRNDSFYDNSGFREWLIWKRGEGLVYHFSRYRGQVIEFGHDDEFTDLF